MNYSYAIKIDIFLFLCDLDSNQNKLNSIVDFNYRYIDHKILNKAFNKHV